MWLMLSVKQPDDYVIATNETHSVREFLEVAFAHARLRLAEICGDDENYFPSCRSGFYSSAIILLAKQKLGWAAKTTFNALAKLMVDADVVYR